MAGMAMTPFTAIPALIFWEAKRLTPLTVEPAMTQSLPTAKVTRSTAELEMIRSMGIQAMTSSTARAEMTQSMLVLALILLSSVATEVITQSPTPILQGP